MSACGPSGSSPLEEEKEPHFLAGKSRASTLDYKGAIECFEKALQINPKSASAHFELAWIFDQKEVDPVAAVYHYQRYLLLRPNADNTDLAKQRIMICKQALAETVALGPVTEKMQRQFEQVTEDNKRLIEENKQLREKLEKWSSYAARLQTPTNPSGAQAPQLPRAAAQKPNNQPSLGVPAQPATAAQTGTPSSAPPSNRTHSVQSGETPSLIARKYGVRLETLMAANPNLDPRRLRVGQILRIPGS